MEPEHWPMGAWGVVWSRFGASGWTLYARDGFLPSILTDPDTPFGAHGGPGLMLVALALWTTGEMDDE